MKKTLAVLLKIALALSAAFAGSYAFGSETIVGRSSSSGLVGPVEVFQPTTSDTYSFRVARKYKLLFSVGTLGPTAAIDSLALDLTGIEEYVVVVVNGNTTVARQPVFNFKDAAGTTMFTITPATCAATATCTYSFGKGAAATGITAGYALTPPAQFQLTAAAPGSGTGNGAVWIYGR